MRRFLWLAVAAALLAGVWTVVPSALVRQRLASALREGLQPAGALDVRARATAPALLRGTVDRVMVEASQVRVGEIVAERLSADLQGLRFRRMQGGAFEITGVESGTVEVRVSQDDLTVYLAHLGVASPAVTIDDTGVTATGNLRAGPVMAPMRVRGRFVVVEEADLVFAVESVDVGGLTVPGGVVTTLLGAPGQPIISLRRLPVPARIERVTSASGRVVVTARVRSQP
ncbi:MAG: DUF2993 domain-containing protein [Armatimonadota bacterium]|nr:DUF2993 domain-containing protein [Armatimonadota bacterium]